MTCARLLDLIDAGPLVDVPAAGLRAAREHARSCAACGAAFAAATALGTDLAALPYPAAPPHLAAAVLERIDRVAPRHAAAAAADPAPGRGAATRDWPAWATVSGGLAAALGTVLSMRVDGRPAGEIVALVLRIADGAVTRPMAGVAPLLLMAGLALYLAGLFASVRERRPQA